MTHASKMYVKGIYDRFKYLATWLPNSNVRLGDVGIRDGDEFKRMTSLDELGIAYQVRAGKDPGDFTGTSKSGLSLKTKLQGEVAAGTTLPIAKAGIAVQFSEVGTFVFKAIRCVQDEIEDKLTVGRVVLEMVQAGTWSPDWALVDTLVSAGSATIVVANSQDASLELTAEVPIAEMDLANLDAGLTVTSQNGDVIHFIASQGLSPLFKLSEVRTSFIKKLLGNAGAITFGGPSHRGPAQPLPDGDPFEEVVP